MSQEDAVRFLYDQGLPAGGIRQCMVDLFSYKAIGYSTVTRPIRQLSWRAPETPKGRPGNFSIDTSCLKVLNDDPTASMREVAQEAKFSASTVFYILTTLVGNSYRICRFVAHNLPEEQKTDRLRQSYELLEILQNTKRLRWRFIRMRDESWFC
jgi:hypothetical protein